MSEKKYPKNTGMRYCMIKSCKYFKGTSDPKVHFFRTRPETPKKWIESISKHQDIVNMSFVCQFHFEPELLIESQSYPSLQAGAVPTIFPSRSRKQNVEKYVGNNLVQKIGNSMSTHAARLRIVRLKSAGFTRSEQILNLTPKPTIKIEDLTFGNNRMDVEDSSSCSGCAVRDSEIQKMKIEIKDLKEKLERQKKLTQYFMLKSKETSKMEDPIVPEIETIGSISDSDDDVIHIDSTPDNETSIRPYFANKPSVQNVKRKFRKQDDATVKPSDNLKVKPSIISDRCALLKPFQCGKCNESFEKPLELRDHMKIHTEIYIEEGSYTLGTFECYVCKSSCESINQVKAHLKNHDKREKCIVCCENLKIDEIAKHLCVTQEHNIKCNYCEQRFTSTKNLLNHLKDHKVDVKKHKCSDCPTQFKMEILKNCHQIYHTINFMGQCDKCSKKCGSQWALTKHKCQLKLDDNPTCEATHLCEQCGKCFSTVQNLYAHMKSHGEKTIKCPNCPQLFKRIANLRRHSYIHRNVKFNCTVCPNGFTTPHGLTKHMRLHHSSSSTAMMECDICFKKMKQTSMKDHKKTHKRKGRFDCEYCNSSFKYNGDLNRHLRIHLGEEIYKCDQCGKRFKYPLDLRNHSFEHYKEEQANILINTKQELA